MRYLDAHPERVTTLHDNARYFRSRLTEMGLAPLPGADADRADHPRGDGEGDSRQRDDARRRGLRDGFGYPVVPQGHARVRCQISAAHSKDDLDFALAAFKKVGAKLGLI